MPGKAREGEEAIGGSREKANRDIPSKIEDRRKEATAEANDQATSSSKEKTPDRQIPTQTEDRRSAGTAGASHSLERETFTSGPASSGGRRVSETKRSQKSPTATERDALY
ncbi:MAG TPA: hypothetical protein VM118_13635 [Acidobacteriota bacterium]|nr:hypothetical protein [Acidobacteriota bacterium]